MIKPELRPYEPVEPGYAALCIEDWQGATEGVKISIQRNQDRCFLNGQGQWVNNEEWLLLPELQEVDGAAEARVGPELVDALLAERQVAYRVTVIDDIQREVGGLKIANGVLSSLAKGEHTPSDNVSEHVPPAQEPPVSIPTETPSVELIVSASHELPEPQPIPVDERIGAASSASAKKPNKGMLIVLTLLVVAGVLWWLLKPQEKQAPVIASASVTAPCAMENMTKGNGLEFVKSCLRSQPSSLQVQEIISQAKNAGQCDIAQRLYAYKSQSGDKQIALRYAQEYDPKTATKKGCFVADAQTAIYWYEILINQDPQNSEAKARLAALKK
ncbi:hypothetical protein [Xenorhabdus bovienii]|uniref:hypothetical protein n=1 Tax=Xenorhabdus bovienii TaxID=40576 RepID=UPI0004DA573D|nr:hypothetical protein [Xenorhabdus bovienii]CDG89924.1 conserved hypothetical protein [Xenorhabdus bovienii str. feltiae France]CDG94268.1 conserved hypothetical protein [Xenorhabdus bovienii str. feltiae Florida]